MKRTLRSIIFATLIALACDQASATVYNVQVGSGGNFFNPASGVTMAIGDTIIFTLVGGSHNVAGFSIPTGASSFGSPSPMGSTYSYVPNVSGTYQYYCTFHSSGTTGMAGSFVVTGCTGPTTPSITSSNGSSACIGATPISLSTTAQAGSTYAWYNGATQVSGATASSLNIPTTAANAGSYTVKVTRCSTTLTSAPFAVTMNTLPAPAFTHTHTGLTYNFTNTTPSTAANTYVWTFSDGSPNQTTTNATRTFTTGGSYTVTLKATTTTSGCAATGAPVAIQASLGIGTLAGESYTILPNPATAAIHISAPVGAAFQLTDMSGRSIKAPVAVSGTAAQMDVTAVPAGLYLLRISYGTAMITEKVNIVH